MNALLIGVLIALLLFGIYGWRKGALCLVFSLVEVVVLVIIIGLLVTNFFSFIGIFIAAIILLFVVGKALKLFSRLPVIHGINRFLGLFAGLLLGLIFVWLFLWVAEMFSDTAFGTWTFAMVGQSRFLTWLYFHNGVQQFASGHFAWYNP